MNYLPQNDMPDRVRDAEDTLRIIARVPAPHGLADRVQANLRTAPRGSFLTNWRFAFDGWMYSPALRGVAAAAIVCVVAGGGWSIYSRVQPASNTNVVVMPARVGGGFSNAGAVRKPDTLNGPVLTHAVEPEKQNVVKPAPQVNPQTTTPKAQPATHKKKAAPAPPR